MLISISQGFWSDSRPVYIVYYILETTLVSIGCRDGCLCLHSLIDGPFHSVKSAESEQNQHLNFSSATDRTILQAG